MGRNLPLWSFGLVALVIAAIAGFNLWAYNCGYCALQDMKQVGPQVKAVLLLVLTALTVWIVLVLRRNNQVTAINCCACGRNLLPQWDYCPDCGGRR